jgi:hypothetical protein
MTTKSVETAIIRIHFEILFRWISSLFMVIYAINKDNPTGINANVSNGRTVRMMPVTAKSRARKRSSCFMILIVK